MVANIFYGSVPSTNAEEVAVMIYLEYDVEVSIIDRESITVLISIRSRLD